jgi:hypothetical protein
MGIGSRGLPQTQKQQTEKIQNMKSITVKYGVDSVTKQVEADFTFGDLQESDTFKAALGFGDKTKALVDGIEQNRDTVIPANATVRIETAANTKA